ncbi:YceH family protein [Cellvibrio sp. OA-2007]|uniref:YceH family protein n=1 Tax=Cellvibrio sp. OA-2007 TaxID=529823 RepID=UPI00078031E7|nr:YceH family protein [Cellvibrio sp. OA-2007]
MEPTSTALPPEEPALLNAIEARVLGSLMEKQLTTPDQYPLTLNSLLLACNQKTSREPISNYESGAVQRCVSELQDRNYIAVDYGNRAARYDQRLTRVLSVDKQTHAILTVLLLRGPQTIAEILTRTQRMAEFASHQALEEKLQQLCNKTKPLIVHIPRQVGQREDRYMHLLCGAPDLAAIAAMQNASTDSSANKSSSFSKNNNDEQVTQLEQKVQQLENRIDLLEKQVATLMDLNGVSNADLS